MCGGYLQEVDRAKLAEAGCNVIFEPVSLYHQGESGGRLACRPSQPLHPGM